MSLLNQFQGIIGSLIFGSLFLFTWDLFNRIFYSKSLKWFRFPFETALFVYLFYVYYCFLSYFTSGILNIFFGLSFLLGAFLYQEFYACHFQNLFEQCASSICRVFRPIRLNLKKRHDKIKQRKALKKSHESKKQTNKSLH